MKVADSTRRELESICEAQDRTLSYVARELMIRGLAAFRSDGLLKEPVTERPLAPVVAHIGPADAAAAADIDEVRRTISDDEVAEIESRLRPRRTRNVAVLKEKAR